MKFVRQPACSPDFNALDLGALNSLASGVREPLLVPSSDPDENSVRNWDRICRAVQQRWEEWDCIPRLDSIFDTKSRVLHLAYEHDGGNEFSVPHSHTPREERTATLPISELAAFDSIAWPKEDYTDPAIKKRKKELAEAQKLVRRGLVNL